MGGILDIIARGGPLYTSAQLNKENAATALTQKQAAEATARTATQEELTRSQNLENQRQQRALRDQEILGRVYAQAAQEAANPPQQAPQDGSGQPAPQTAPVDPYSRYNMRKRLIQAGLSPSALMAHETHTIEMEKKVAELTKEKHANEMATLAQVGEHLAAIQEAETPEARKAVIQSTLPNLYRLEPGQDWNAIVSDPNKLWGAVAGHGMTESILKRRKEKADIAQTGATTAKTTQEVAKAEREQAMQELSTVTDPQSYADWKAKHPKIDSPNTYIPKFVARMTRSAVPVKDQPKFDIDTLKAEQGIIGNNDFETVFLPAYAAKLGKKIQQLTPDEKMASFSAYTQAKADPEVRASLLASRATMEALRQIQLSQVPTADQAQAVARDIIAHRMAPEQMASMFGGFGSAGQNFKRMVFTEGKKLDPEFNYEQASAEYGLTKSQGFQQTVRYMDSALNSLPRMQAAADKLSNSSVKSIASLLNSGKSQFNDVDLKAFNTDRVLVGDEIAKILQGGGTGSGTSDKKLEQAQEIFGKSDNPAAIASAIKEVNALLGYRRKTLTQGTYMEHQEPAAHEGGGAAEALPKGGGKVLDKGTAQQFYKAAGGDPKKAQKMAEDAGWKVQ